MSGINNRIESLRTKHKAAETSLKELQNSPGADPLTIAGVKKYKLQLKDEIAELEARLASEAELVEAKKTEMAADEEPLPDVEIVQTSAPKQTAFVAAECYGHMPNPVEKAA